MNIDEMLEAVKKQITQLIAAYESQKDECERCRAELQRCQSENEAYRKQIIELERQIDNQRLAGAFLSGDNAESKKRIDRLIKEIDKCISLMEG